jgi:hypothetical protein
MQIKSTHFVESGFSPFTPCNEFLAFRLSIKKFIKISKENFKGR